MGSSTAADWVTKMAATTCSDTYTFVGIEGKQQERICLA